MISFVFIGLIRLLFVIRFFCMRFGADIMFQMEVITFPFSDFFAMYMLTYMYAFDVFNALLYDASLQIRNDTIHSYNLPSGW